MPEQLSRISSQSNKQVAIALAIHLAGFALGYISQGLILQGFTTLDSGLVRLAPVGDVLYVLGLIIVVALAARIGVPLRYFVVAGAIMGIGLFYKAAVHEIHVYSGLALGLPHPVHIGIGSVVITASVVALTVLSITTSRRQLTARTRNISK